MKKYTILGSLGLFLLIFFQNCGKPPSADSSAEMAGVSTSTPQQYNKYAVGDFEVLSLWDFKKARFLELNLSTGVITAFDPAGKPQGVTYNVPSNKMLDLQVILKGAEICEPISDEMSASSSSEQVCAMVYRYPYATMIGQGDEVRLGEKTSSCDVAVDLCGDKAAQLQAWVQALVLSL